MSNFVNKFCKQIMKKGPRDKTPPLSDDERCTRNDGKQWRCRHRRAAGQSMCHYHLQCHRNRNESARRFRKGDSKSNFSRKDEVKSGMKSSEPVQLKSTTSDIDKRNDEYSNEEDVFIQKEGTSSTKKYGVAQITKNEISKDKEPTEREGTKVLATKERQSYVGSDGEESDFYESSDEYSNGEDTYTEKEETSSAERSNTGQIIENEINKNKKARERKSIGPIPSKEWLNYFCSDGESDGEKKNDVDQHIGKKRKSVSLEKLEKVENKGKQNSDLSGSDYKSSIQKGLNNEEKPELSKKIFKGGDLQMCNQCQRNDKGGMDCTKRRFGVPCMKCWQNSMCSDTGTRKEENESVFDLKLKITTLENKLLEEKHRFDTLQTVNNIYKSESLSLKEIISGLEMELNKFRERESENRDMLTKLFGMMASYDAKLAEFMKYGDENSSLREKNNAVVVKKELEGALDDKMPKQIIGGDVDDIMIGKCSKKGVIKEIWRRENSSACAVKNFCLK